MIYTKSDGHGGYYSDHVGKKNEEIQKLGELEAFEKMFKIDLLTLLKAPLEGVWIITNKCGYAKEKAPYGPFTGAVIDLENYQLILNECYGQGDFKTHRLKFSDLGVTWALDKEGFK